MTLAGAPSGEREAPDPERGGPADGRPAVGESVARNLTRGTTIATDVEVAAGIWAKFMGLMGRPGLPDGAALWLPDSNGIHMMFMRFPIDAVFVGRSNEAGERPVVAVREALPAWRGLVPLVRGAHGVLELAVGTVAASRTVVGDRISMAREEPRAI